MRSRGGATAASERLSERDRVTSERGRTSRDGSRGTDDGETARAHAFAAWLSGARVALVEIKRRSITPDRVLAVDDATSHPAFLPDAPLPSCLLVFLETQCIYRNYRNKTHNIVLTVQSTRLSFIGKSMSKICSCAVRMT